MSAPILTGSGLERAMLCDGPAYLQHIDSVSDDAARGSAVHAFFEAVSTKGREAALDDAPEDLRPALEALDLSRLPVGSSYAAEVAFAYDPLMSAARELGRGIGRRYEVGDTEIAGTADVVALLDDDGVFVADFKSGWSRRTAAKENPQLLFYALAACRAYKRSRAAVQIIRVMEDGTTWTDEAALDAFDLDEFASRVLDLASRYMEVRNEIREPRLAEGEQCRWCPSFSVCPAKVALLAKPLAFEALSPEVAATAYAKVKLYKAAVERAEEILRDYARTHPIPLEDGTVYGVRIDHAKNIDAKVARGVLSEWFGEPVAEQGISYEASQASLKRALKAAGNRGISFDDLLAEIQKRGGLKVIQAPKLVAHKPKEAA